jgi:hypothetical protein
VFERDVISFECLPHPHILSTTRSDGNILGFGGRKGNRVLFLKGPWKL